MTYCREKTLDQGNSHEKKIWTHTIPREKLLDSGNARNQK